jgi:hypothetical protein
MLIVINILLILIAIYFGFGLIFAIYFFLKGAEKIDPLLKDSKWTVRLLLIPGAMVIWVLWVPKLFRKNSI